MTLTSLFSFGLLAITLTTDALCGDPSGAVIRESPGGQQEPQFVSLIELIARGNAYHNKPVIVAGFYYYGFEASGLFLSKDDAYHGITKNAVWVRFDFDKLGMRRDRLRKHKRHYIGVQGIFDMDDHGHLGAYSGAVVKVNRIIEIK